MKREYELSPEDFEKLLEASKPVPYLVVGGVPPRSQQENANDAWRELGDRLGFDYMTVEPVHGKGHQFFRAEPKKSPAPRPHRLICFWPEKVSMTLPCDEEPTFEQVREHLGMEPGATLELVRCVYENMNRYMLVDEDGLSKKLPFNSDASVICGFPIVGPAAIWTGPWS